MLKMAMATELAIQLNITTFDSIEEARRIDNYRGDIDIVENRLENRLEKRDIYIDIDIYSDREIPTLPRDIIEIIATYCYKIDTLLKLAIFFPYLVAQIIKRNIAFCMPMQIPHFIDDIINWENLVNLDNNMQIFKMSHSSIFEYFQNISSIYTPYTWLDFIIDIDAGSNFHKTYSGNQITKYIISYLSNNELRSLSYKVLAYIVKHNLYLYNNKLTNIIYQRLSRYFSETKKDKGKFNLISLLTVKDKDNVKYDKPAEIVTLLSNMSHYYINVSAIIISALTIHSTKILDLLLETNKINKLNAFDAMDISHFIVSNPLTDYLLVMMIEYYFKLISFNNDSFNCMRYIFELAIHKKNHHIINIIYGIEKHKRAIPTLIINTNKNDFYNKNDCENLKYLLLYCKNLDLSLLSWSAPSTLANFHLEYQYDLYTIDSYILLFENAKLYDTNLDNMDRNLLLKIYNYFNKYYIFNKLHITTSKVYPELDAEAFGSGIDISIIKEHLHYLFIDLTEYFTLVNKCQYIIKLSDTKFINSSSNIKNISKNLLSKSIYLFNIYTFILKHKLYYSIKLNKFITILSKHTIEILKCNDINIKLIEFNKKLIELIEKCMSIDQSVGEGEGEVMLGELNYYYIY